MKILVILALLATVVCGELDQGVEVKDAGKVPVIPYPSYYYPYAHYYYPASYYKPVNTPVSAYSYYYPQYKYPSPHLVAPLQYVP